MKKIIVALGVFGIFAGSLTQASAGYFNTTPLARCDSVIIRTLQTGSENEDVYTLQQMLARGGYLGAQPNGYFGPATRYAVQRFQADNNISVTGTVGEITRNAVNERLCDGDVRGDTLSYGEYDSYSSYSYSSGTTYVDAYDPFVRVVSPTPANPTLYANPVTRVAPISNVVPASNSVSRVSNVYSGPLTGEQIGYTATTNLVTSSNTTAPYTNSSSGIASTNIIYSPYIGYTYGITPQSGSLTISTPVANTTYNEGDTVTIAWTTNNINAGTYTVVLENTTTGQKQAAVSTQGNTASFVLTKALLDAVCVGVCDNNQQGSFRIAITTPITDIAGISSTFRAAIAPITIKRPYANFGAVSITASKNPVAAAEVFKLYVNIPTGASWNANLYGQYSFKIRAICPSGVTASIAGVACGQDFVLPYAPVYFQSEIPAMISNTSWFRQDVRFELTVTNLAGQVIGTSTTNVTASASPFTW